MPNDKLIIKGAREHNLIDVLLAKLELQFFPYS
jgi:hypothetical protein